MSEVDEAASRQCPYCAETIKAAAKKCRHCGEMLDPILREQSLREQSLREENAPKAPAAPPKTRVAYIFLGLFLGALGIHNFYAGYSGRGVAQLLISLLSCGSLTPIVWIWNIIEVCTVSTDANGTRMT